MPDELTRRSVDGDPRPAAVRALAEQKGLRIMHSGLTRCAVRTFRALVGLVSLALATFTLYVPAHAAAAAGCEGGGFSVTNLADGSTVGGDQTSTIAASRLRPRLRVKGTYAELTV